MAHTYIPESILPRSIINQAFEIKNYTLPRPEESAATHSELWCHLWDARVAEILQEIQEELGLIFKTGKKSLFFVTENEGENALHHIRCLTQYQSDLFMSCHLVHGLCSVFKASGPLLQGVTLHMADVVNYRNFSSTTFCRPHWANTSDMKELSSQQNAFKEYMQAVCAKLGSSHDAWGFVACIMRHASKRHDISERISIRPDARSLASWFSTMALFPQDFDARWEHALLDNTLTQDYAGSARPRL